MKFFVAFALITALSGCRVPPPDSFVGKLINCSSRSVQENWPTLLGPVNTCLTGAAAGATPCLLGLIKPTAGFTEDVVACLVNYQGQQFAASAQANSGDIRSARAALNAREFIKARDYKFTQ